MMDALAKGDEVDHRRRHPGQGHQGQRHLRHHRNRCQHRNRGAEALDHHAAAERHPEVPVSLTGGHRAARLLNIERWNTMNRYPVWKYILIVIALLLGALYTAPNYFGESPALQVTTGKATVKITSDTAAQVEAALKSAGIAHRRHQPGRRPAAAPRCARASPRTDDQFKAKLALEQRAQPRPGRPRLHRHRQPGEEHAEVDAGRARDADEPRPRLARRRALPAAGRCQRRRSRPRSRASRPASAASCATRTCATPASSACGNRIEVKFRDAATRTAAREALAAPDRPTWRSPTPATAPT